MNLHARIGGLVFATAILTSTVVVCLSPLSRPYVISSLCSVAAGVLLAALLMLCLQKASATRKAHRGRRWPGDTSLQSSHAVGLLDVAILSQIVAGTIQAQVASYLPSEHLPLHSTPGMDLFYLLLAFAAAFIVMWLILVTGRQGRTWAALLSAGILGSALYLRSFSVAEAGPVYGPVLALSLIAASTLRSQPVSQHTMWFSPEHAGVLFLAAVALASILSPGPVQNLYLWFRFAALLLLAFVLSRSLTTWAAWDRVSIAIVAIAGLAPALLALVKLVSLAQGFGIAAALSYRWHPTELGGANLASRSVVCVVPLALAITKEYRHRIAHFIGISLALSALFVVLYSRSWHGLLALVCASGIYLVGTRRNRLKALGQRFATSSCSRLVLVSGTVIGAVILATALIYAASQLNVYSFNGRFAHWYGALLEWKDHPLIGSGLGTEMIYAPYADQVALVVNTQTTLDDPLRMIKLLGGSLGVHAHNLFLELGARTGLLGFLSFVAFLTSLFVAGIADWRRSTGTDQLRMAACLSGIVGALVWGMLDVLAVSPPFFSFPVWGLIGLLLAVRRIVPEADQERMPSSAGKVARIDHWRAILTSWILVALALLTVLLPALASAHYATGFLALQERRWSDAASHLEKSSRYGWLDPLPYPLLAETHLAQGDLASAQQEYQLAASLQPGFSLYLSQLGWLAWLQGDLDEAIGYLEQAVTEDPAEIGRDGLHADLGLAHVAEGRHNQALSEIKQSIKLFPESVLASDWIVASAGFADAEPALDPTYAQAPSSELDKRILAHLGAPDVTERLFALQLSAPSPISLLRVLDEIEEDFRQARVRGDRDAPLLLAALAEASRLAGLAERAEQAYLDFQALQPSSAYGFRDLGILYREQGRLTEAQSQLEQAVAVSPRDVDSRLNLALVYLDRGMSAEAKQELDSIVSQSLITPFRSRLFDPDLYVEQARLYQVQGNLEQAIDALSKLARIRGEPGDYLALADLYRQLDRPQQAVQQCTQAAEALLRTWPRPLDPQLREIGLCLSHWPGELPGEIASLAREHPLAGNVLLGHVYQAMGELDQALTAFQAAADARPDEGAPHYFLGETYWAFGQPEMAAVEYQRATELDTLESLPLLAWGRMQWSMGERDAAVSTFRAAVEATPGWGQAHVALGNALLALGDREGAAEHYQLAQLADRDFHEGLVLDFAVQLANAEVDAPDTGYVKNDYFTIDSDERRVLFMHPNSQACYTVDVPEGSSLAFHLATSPESWDQPGDGVTFTVFVESRQGTEQVFSTYIDPKHEEADRRWHPHTVDLGTYAGQTVTIILETTSGPAGDNRFDWAGWGTPRLLVP